MIPVQSDVDALRDLLDLIEGWPSNDQKARFLLSSNWFRDGTTGGQAMTYRVDETAEADGFEAASKTIRRWAKGKEVNSVHLEAELRYWLNELFPTEASS